MNNDQFTALISRYEKPVLSYISKMVFYRDIARDITQETFTKLWDKRESLRTNRPVFSLIYRVATNLCIDYLRKSKPVHLESYYDIPVPDAQIESIDSTELYQLILQSLEHLKSRQKTVFILRDIEGFDFAEIAQITRMPVANIRSNLYLARKNIRTILEVKYNINREYLNEM